MTLIQFANAFAIAITFARWRRRSEATATVQYGTNFSCSALTLYAEWQEAHPAHKNPVVVPVSLSFVRAPGYPGSDGCKTVEGLRAIS